MYHNAKKDLDYALYFTRVHQAETNIALREAACLALQVPYVLEPIAEDDLIAGGMKHGFVGFSPQFGGVYTYYCHLDMIREALDCVRDLVDEAYIETVNKMCAYWEKERTEAKVHARMHERYPDKTASFYFSVCRVAGLNVDLDLLLQSGLNGLKARTDGFRKIHGASSFYDAADASVDVIPQACLRYAEEAAQLQETATGQRRADLDEIAKICRKIATEKPGSFKEALQLLWIYAVCSDLMNYGRMDNYLAEFYCRDIDNGSLTEEEAIRWLSSLYRNIIKVGKIHDSRIVIGGMGRKNPSAADRLALLLIKVSRIVVDVVPQLTLRYYAGMDERLMDETLQNIAKGAVYPIIYSDETTVPAIEKIYQVDKEIACRWVPLGCGEYILEGYGPASPNSIITIAFALDLVLHKGTNSFFHRQEMEVMKDPADFQSFEDLFAEYDRIMKIACEYMVYGDELNYKVAGEEACYLHASLLTHDCIEKNRTLLQGGCRFLGDTSEVFGLITVADSLMAIKNCVYDRNLFTLPELIHMCDANFEGYEKERNILLAAPKYGNDDDEADAMAVRVFTHVARVHEVAAKNSSLFPYKVCSVNNSGSADRGAILSATPDGRLRGQAMSNGTSPSPGADRNGLTATLNSMAKIDPALHVGVVNNIRFNRDLLIKNMDMIKVVLKTFFEHNGVQTNLSSIGKDDLEQALLYPQRYANLLVRIGGFSARFVELDRTLQNELIARTTYEAL